MNRRYIDFVPKKASVASQGVREAEPERILPAEGLQRRGMADIQRREPRARRGVVRREVVQHEVSQRKTTARAEDFEVEEVFAVKETVEETPKFGVIEDFAPKFVNTEVEKRPLGETGKREVAALKAIKIPKIPLGRGHKTEADEGVRTGILKRTKRKQDTDEILDAALEKAEKLDDTMKVPKSPFVNTEKVTKRPLSRNAYPEKRVIETKEEKPSAPVTIINKPERDSRAGLAVTIVITIILGAAAGTVAFLLLPK